MRDPVNHLNGSRELDYYFECADWREMKNAHTKAANGLGSIRKRAVKRNNGKTYEYWEGRVTIVSNYNGKQQKTLTAKTQAELIAKMKEANDTMKSADSRHKRNIAKFEKKSEATNKAMDELGALKLEILHSFDEFSNTIEKIQNRRIREYNGSKTRKENGI